MQAVEFGKENTLKIVLIPGNMMSWRQFERLIPLLEKDYHVIAVSTDGYDGTGETTFTTSEASAEKLEAYIRDNLDGHIELVFGESFGCATAGTLFHRQRVKADSLILNGPQYMSLGIFNGFVTKVIPHNQYRLYSRIQNRKRLPLLLKLYTRSNDEALLAQFSATPRKLTLETLQNCAREGLKLYEEIDLYEPDPKAKVGVWYGAKEPNMKKTVQKLKRAFPNAEIHSFPGFGHGELVAHPELMVKEIKGFVERNLP
jgi:Predicted hydrolases or acyltransferases (alpha/beta hydrolase superfamily)